MIGKLENLAIIKIVAAAIFYQVIERDRNCRGPRGGGGGDSVEGGGGGGGCGGAAAASRKKTKTIVTAVAAATAIGFLLFFIVVLALLAWTFWDRIHNRLQYPIVLKYEYTQYCLCGKGYKGRYQNSGTL